MNKNNRITIIVFCFLLLLQWIDMLGFLDTYSLPAYFVSYQYGIGVRRFIGTIIGIVFPNYLSKKVLFVFVGCFTFCLIFLFSKFLTKAISITREDNKFAILFITCLLLVAPFSVKFLFSAANYGRLELYLLIIVFAYLLLDIKGLTKQTMYPILILCLIVGVLIHQIFVFLCLPFFAVTVIMQWHQLRYEKVVILKDCLIILALAFLVAYLQFFSPLVDTTLLMSKLERYTNIELHEPAFYYEYSSNMSEHYQNFMLPNKTRLLVGFIGTMIMMSPFIYIIVSIWRNAFKFDNKNNAKNKYTLIILCHLFFLPLFIFAMDYGRWFAVLFLFSFSILLYMFNKKDEGIIYSMELLQTKIMQRPVVFMAIIVYAACLQTFQASLFFPLLENILNFLGLHEATIVY